MIYVKSFSAFASACSYPFWHASASPSTSNYPPLLCCTPLATSPPLPPPFSLWVLWIRYGIAFDWPRELVYLSLILLRWKECLTPLDGLPPQSCWCSSFWPSSALSISTKRGWQSCSASFSSEPWLGRHKMTRSYFESIKPFICRYSLSYIPYARDAVKRFANNVLGWDSDLSLNQKISFVELKNKGHQMWAQSEKFISIYMGK